MKARWDFDADDNSLPVMVPRSDKTLAAIPPKRVRQLREHLIKALRELRTQHELTTWRGQAIASPRRR